MIKVGSSYIRKFQFFEVVSGIKPPIDEHISSSPSNSEDESIENKEKEKPENTEEDYSININDINISDPRQMQLYNDIIFISGKAKHKKSGQMIRENLIMKIKDNVVLDEYYIFNLVYYNFIIKIYDENPYFIFLGSSFIDKNDDMFTETKIKIYNAINFIQNDKVEREKGYEKGEEPYPKYLMKEIKLLKKINSDKIVNDIGEQNMKEFESLQNLNSFAISDDFIYAAINIDKSGILLIYGYPNLLECESKNIIMKYLPKIIYNEKEVNITNIKFSKISLNENNNFEIVLYAVGGHSIFYYKWNSDPNKNMFPIIPQPKLVTQDKLAPYNSRIQVKDSYLLIGNDKMIGEYYNLQLGQTWFFEGKKSIINYFNNYIYFVTFDGEDNSLQIFDKTNKFFVYQKTDKKKILSICNDTNFIYIFYEENQEKKNIIKLKEKTNKEKFETFFHKKFFDDALVYAKNLGFDEEKLAEISYKYANYEFSKGHYERAIEEYIKIIKYNEPSVIIQKFLEKSKMKYLVKYLESIVDNFNMNVIDLEEYKSYTTLLLNCYIMQEEVSKFKTFINRKGQLFSKDLIKVVVDVCVETDNPDVGLIIAKEHKMIYEYLHILITQLHEYDKVLEIMEDPEKGYFNISNEEKVELYLKFAEYFLVNKKKDDDNIEDKDEENFMDKFFELVLKFIENNRKDLDKNDIIKLVVLFMDLDKYFKTLFDIIDTYNLDYNKEIIHRRIQLYLLDLESDKNNKSYRTDIISILKNPKYISKYDNQYLITLFKTFHFYEGIEVLSEVSKYYQDLLLIYMKMNDYKKIIKLCKTYGAKELSFWSTSLNYFLNKDLRYNMKPDQLKKINNSLEEFLDKLLESKIMSAIDILDMINEQNDNISYDVLTNFMKKTMEEEIDSIENKQDIYEDYESKINKTCNEIKDLKTKAYVFNLNKCCECGSEIEFPYYAFHCGHAIHQTCLNVNKKAKKNIECPKCKETKDNLISEIQKNKNYEKELNSLDKLEKVLEHKEHKLDYIYELYGKGLFNFDSIEPNNTNINNNNNQNEPEKK